MSTSQYILNLALLAWILTANLGSRVLTVRRVIIPLVVVAAAGAVYLRDLPTAGHDLTLELIGLAAGLVLGASAALAVRVRREHERVVTTAGITFAAIWVGVIGGRMLFAYGAENWFGPSIGRFSHQHLITGADAWTAAFVLMALAMVLSRVVVTGVRAARVSGRLGATSPVGTGLA
jgi:hypothetical protein